MSGKKKLSIDFVQLPIPEVHDLYTQGNIPLAAGYLKAAALKEGILTDENCRILPRDTANYAGDTAIINRILKGMPGTVGFTNYMWNIDRNIHLAKKIKEAAPEIMIIFGGPEIVPGHWAFENPYIDAFVCGEGEEAFCHLLRDLQKNEPLKPMYRSAKPVDLKEIPNPYLERILVPTPKESLFIETMRGCPYPCKYCFYSKSYADLRFFPDAYLPRLFQLAREYRVPEIYFMDPSFNVIPQLEEKLERVRSLNTTGIPIHTEIRLEGVTKEIARLMKLAGFRSVEAGLQSVQEKSLAAIGRTWNRKKFLQGARFLQEQEIDIKTGIILGLPYDTLRDLEDTLDFVIESNLAESLEIYPLSLIPGTRLRDETPDLGITYMPHPPYWVMSTGSMDGKEFRYAVEMIENKLDIEFFPPVIPRFANSHPDYIHFLDLRDSQERRRCLEELYRAPERVGHSLTLLLGENKDVSQLVELGRWLQRVSPFTLVQVVSDQSAIPLKKDLQPLAVAFYNPHHYFNHIHYYKADSQGQYSLRFFHLTGSLKTAESYLYQPRFCDLILRYTPGLLEKGQDILAERPVLLVDREISSREITGLSEIYQGFESLLIPLTSNVVDPAARPLAGGPTK